MKKIVLSALLLTLFPTICWADESANENCTAKISLCPKERPYLSEEIHLDYFYPPNLQSLDKYSSYLTKLYSIPEYPVDAEPCDTKKLCEKVKEIKAYQAKVPEQNELIEKENWINEAKRLAWEQKNTLIDKANEIYQSYRTMIVVGHVCFLISDFDLDPIRDPVTYVEVFEETPLEKWIRESESVIQLDERILEENQKKRTENLKIEQENEKIEKENAKVEKQFWAYYTPEKIAQLMDDHKKALDEKCAGCDYPKPLQLNEDDCKECPNREYVDGKCVLKQDNKKKG